MADDSTDSITESVVATIDHAVRLHGKIQTLEVALREALETAASLAGEMGKSMDYATFYRLAGELRELDIPGGPP